MIMGDFGLHLWLGKNEIHVFGHAETVRPARRKGGKCWFVGQRFSTSNASVELEGDRVKLFHFISRQNVKEIERVRKECPNEGSNETALE